MGERAVSGTATSNDREPERVASLEAEIASLKVDREELWRVVRDHGKRFDTLQTPLWKRIWFRIDGWPGQNDLNGTRAWRPWH